MKNGMTNMSRDCEGTVLLTKPDRFLIPTQMAQTYDRS